MNGRIYAAGTGRILRQLRADHRSVAMVLLVPSLLMVLLYFLYRDVPAPPNQQSSFDRIAITMLGILPFVVMFLLTSISMQRERSTGTLERLLTTPMSKMDLLASYGSAFSLAAVGQALLACALAFGLLGLDIEGSIGWVLVIAVLGAMLGVAIGLLCSAFARTEFQAVQFMPVVVIPQLFLCGLLVARDQMPSWLGAVSNLLPLSYLVDALQEISVHPDATRRMGADIAVVVMFTVAALTGAAATLRRRTP
ncbi:antibiotic ABC transporter permease [Rhodococcus sp. 05-2254-5]|uniref:ABC transporter permease n=1 Tax=unclassified Rhodococcus (in: high G+C Gram-positive bacteria) TaxID=192944 RepID=UPI00070B8557|nr:MULTISPECIES: ABC transporter permease [unclassified Rhodococcus (in: high G+C Gram-positive bacteria)]KQU33785.1 antibiotic ABC transporter permease [Rhodococcus sp. Leaf233]OZE39378.1 antibiotic ABC transporter permease [Rhodococcus sp. 05-2254-5]OZE59319.1 antibiotic ABC transporter permease [Rhodococcus sp. 05-2254-1]